MTELIHYIIEALAPLGIPVYASGDVSDDRSSAYAMVEAVITGGHDGLPPNTLADGDITVAIYTAVTDDQTGARCRSLCSQAVSIIGSLPLNGRHGDWYLRYVDAPSAGTINISDLFQTATISASTILQSTAI